MAPFIQKSYRKHCFAYFLALFSCFMTLAMVVYPKEAFESAVMGLNLWWNVVFPALLPFFVLSEILMGFGIVHFIGVLLEPLMRPLFNVPGVGALASTPVCLTGTIIPRYLSRCLFQYHHYQLSLLH
ncbi:MAG: hypothetical protein E6713_12350 [Sporomusaceae bacterium]|nr:hypothetical protein [Sporomusaceae bacterium]